MNHRRIRNSCGIAALIAACAFAPSAHAQQPTLPLIPLTSPPTAPTNLTNGDLVGLHSGQTPLVLGWGQFFPSGPGLVLNPLATHFIVCFRAYTGATAPPCTLASNDFLEAVAAPTARLTRTGNFFRLAPGVAIQEAQLDKPFRFTVGACSALVERSCRYTAADIFYSTRNVIAETASENGLTTPVNWKINAQATNTGDSDVPQFSGLVEAFEVLGFGAPGRDCVVNVDDAHLRFDTTLVVLDKMGGRTPMTMVSRSTNGSYNGPPVAGIFRLGTFSTFATFVTPQPSIGANFLNPRGVGIVDFPIALNAVMPRTFVLITTLDTGNVIREFNEGDNARAKCRVR
jgi:hypothetical protein